MTTTQHPAPSTHYHDEQLVLSALCVLILTDQDCQPWKEGDPDRRRITTLPTGMDGDNLYPNRSFRRRKSDQTT